MTSGHGSGIRGLLFQTILKGEETGQIWAELRPSESFSFELQQWRSQIPVQWSRTLYSKITSARVSLLNVIVALTGKPQLIQVVVEVMVVGGRLVSSPTNKTLFYIIRCQVRRPGTSVLNVIYSKFIKWLLSQDDTAGTLSCLTSALNAPLQKRYVHVEFPARE